MLSSFTRIAVASTVALGLALGTPATQADAATASVKGVTVKVKHNKQTTKKIVVKKTTKKIVAKKTTKKAVAKKTVKKASTKKAAPKRSTGDVKCQIINSNTVGSFNWSKMPTQRKCEASLSYGAAGTAQLSKRAIVVKYSKGSRTSNTAVAKATVHELAHHVEYRTTAAQRAKLYKYVGMNNKSGDYFAVKDRQYYDGSLAKWKQAPRERLAESVVACSFGTPNHTGMKLVAKSQCKPFLKDFRSALAVAK